MKRVGIGLAVLVMLAIAAPAGARPPVPGVQDERFITCGTPDERAHAIALAKQLGARTVRINALNSREWRSLGCDPVAAVQAVAAAGLRPFLTVVGDARHARRLVRQVGGQVELYSVWNEPNHPGWRWGPVTANPRSYSRLFRRVSRVIRRLDPSAKVLFGELMPPGFKYTTRVVAHTRIRADGLAIHPYVWADPRGAKSPLHAYIKKWRRKLRTWARRGRLCRIGPRRCRPLPIYATEHGYHAEGFVRDRYSRWVWDGKPSIPEELVAEWLPAAWRVMSRQRLRIVVQYQMLDSEQDWDTALVDGDGPRFQFTALAEQIRSGR